MAWLASLIVIMDQDEPVYKAGPRNHKNGCGFYIPSNYCTECSGNTTACMGYQVDESGKCKNCDHLTARHVLRENTPWPLGKKEEKRRMKVAKKKAKVEKKKRA